MNDTLNHPGRLPKLLQTHGKRAAKKGGKVVTCCSSLRQILPSSPTTSFSLLWRGLSLLYETQATPGRVLNCRAVHQGQPRMKRGHCLALVGALELLSAVDWNILVFQPKCRIRILESTGGSEFRGVPAPIYKKTTISEANDPGTSVRGQVGL
jgi:hypothetical protein